MNDIRYGHGGFEDRFRVTRTASLKACIAEIHEWEDEHADD